MTDKPKRGDVYYVDLNPVKGSEQDGVRPVLVVSNNIINSKAPFVVVVPISRKGKEGPYNVPFFPESIEVDQNSVEELSKKGCHWADEKGVYKVNQVRAVSLERFIGKVGSVKPPVASMVFQHLELSVKYVLSIDGCVDCGLPLNPKGIMCVGCQRIFRKVCTCGTVVQLEAKFCHECGRRF